MPSSALKRPYCDRCKRGFGTLRALEQHHRDSPYHHKCPKCGFDAPSWKDAFHHYQDTRHLWTCASCFGGLGEVFEPRCPTYYAHLTRFNVCPYCELHFHSMRDLLVHHLNDHDFGYECFGCFARFFSLSAMMQHLESGSCASETNIFEINRYAVECKEWKYYISGEEAKEMILQGKAICGDRAFYCRHCPASFDQLSALLQHAEGDACANCVTHGALFKLLEWMKNQWNQNSPW